MLHIENVPKFEGIFIHIGNSAEDTAGCPLVAKAWEVDESFVYKSTQAYTEIYKLIAPEIKAGKEVTIQITDEMLN